MLMLGDINYEVRSVAVDKVQKLHCIIRSVGHCTATIRKQNKVRQAEDKNDSNGTISKPYIQQFWIRQVNFIALSYLEMIDINLSNVSEPPLLKPFVK